MHASVAGHMHHLIVQVWCSKLSQASAGNPLDARRIQVHTCSGAAGLPPACRRRANGAVGATTGASRRTICRCGASWTGARRVRCAHHKVEPLFNHTYISLIHDIKFFHSCPDGWHSRCAAILPKLATLAEARHALVVRFPPDWFHGRERSLFNLHLCALKTRAQADAGVVPCSPHFA